MNKKKLEVLTLAFCVGLIPSLWASFHSLINVNLFWPGLAAAAIYVAAGAQVKNAPKICIGQVLGTLWGVILLYSINFSIVHHYNVAVIAFAASFILGVMAVLITHAGIQLLSHLPSLLCGWAISAGVLGEIPLAKWGFVPVDIILSLLCGVLLVGCVISLFHGTLMKTLVKESK